MGLPDPLFRQLKARAALEGTTIRELVQAAVQKLLADNASGEPRRRVRFPILPSAEPGSLNLTNAEIDELLS
jgi:hypothetical protein